MLGLRSRGGRAVGKREHAGRRSEPQPARVGGHYSDTLGSLPEPPPEFPTGGEPPLQQLAGTSAFRLGLLEAISCPKMGLRGGKGV